MKTIVLFLNMGTIDVKAEWDNGAVFVDSRRNKWSKTDEANLLNTYDRVTLMYKTGSEQLK